MNEPGSRGCRHGQILGGNIIWLALVRESTGYIVGGAARGASIGGSGNMSRVPSSVLPVDTAGGPVGLRRLAPSFIALFVAAIAVTMSLQVAIAHAEIRTFGSDAIEATVADNGMFTIGLRDGNPNLSTDDNRILLYGHPLPDTSFTSMRVDGQDFLLSEVGNARQTQAGAEAAKHSWRLGDLSVEQVLTIVNGSVSARKDTVRIEYVIKNVGTSAHSAGLRILLDTMLGDNDGAPFRIPGTGNVTTERQYEAQSGGIPNYFQAFESFESPNVVSYALLSDERLGARPDTFVAANWRTAENTVWNYVIDEDVAITYDSAALVYWNPVNLAPGESRRYAIEYGISQLAEDLRPPLATRVQPLPKVLPAQGQSLSVYVQNTSSQTVNDARVALVLGDGLRVIGESSVDIGTLEPGAEAPMSISFRVAPADSAIEPSNPLSYSVNVTGNGASPKTIALQTSYVPIDTDGDSLPDEWEINGIDANGDGTIEVDLPAMGANPRRKDLFIQLDWMEQAPTTIVGSWANAGHHHKPKPAALNEVIVAFSKAPVDNPDGSQGITLHIDAGPASIMSPRGDKWGSLSSAGAVPEVKNLGESGGDSAIWEDFYEIKALRFPAARTKVFHYCLFAHQYGGGRSTGIGYMPGADFIVADGAGGGNLSAQEQAGTLMHEFGHNLGLGHGGDGDVNFKPNYLSIMNYSFQMTGLLRNESFGTIDYSREKLDTLNESSLKETSGVGPKAMVGDLGTLYFRNGTGQPGWFLGLATSSPYRVNSLRGGSIDWNGAGGNAEASVKVDLNTEPGKPVVQGEKLTGFDDWESLVYGGGQGQVIGISKASGGATPSGTSAEPSFKSTDPTYDELVKMGLVLRDYRVLVEGDGFVQGRLGVSEVTARFKVTNSGETSDTYQISLDGIEGTSTSGVPSSISLAPGETKKIDANVAIPDGTPDGTTFDVVLTAESVGNPEIVDQTTVVVIISKSASVGSGHGSTSSPVLPIAGVVLLIGAVGLVIANNRRNSPVAAPSASDVPEVVAVSPVPTVLVRITDAQGIRESLVTLPATIGRSSESDLILKDPKVSAHHAKLYSAEDGLIQIEDNGSANGLHVGGIQVSQVVVSVGDQIVIGDTTLELQPLASAPKVPTPRVSS